METALSRYPVHRLARKGSIKIEVTEANERGEAVLLWKVSYNSEYGQPGPLAYKLDTLIINRRIEEASRPIPQSSQAWQPQRYLPRDEPCRQRQEPE